MALSIPCNQSPKDHIYSEKEIKCSKLAILSEFIDDLMQIDVCSVRITSQNEVER